MVASPSLATNVIPAEAGTQVTETQRCGLKEHHGWHGETDAGAQLSL